VLCRREKQFHKKNENPMDSFKIKSRVLLFNKDSCWAGPLFFIHSNPDNLYVSSSFAKLNCMHNPQSLVATFNKTLKIQMDAKSYRHVNLEPIELKESRGKNH
jgi:hypothetical protein